MDFNPEQAFRSIAHGDDAAFAFLQSFFRWFHIFDDLIDGDRPGTPLEMIHEAHFEFLNNAVQNPFVFKHQESLLPVLRISMLAHLESERLKKSPEVLDRITSQVLKSQYQDVFFYTAYLTGGFSHMLAMSRAYRGYDFDPAPPPAG